MTNIAKLYEIRIKKSPTAAKSFNVKRHLSKKVIQDNYDKDYYYMKVYLPVVMAFLKDVDVEFRASAQHDDTNLWHVIKARTPLEQVETELNTFYAATGPNVSYDTKTGRPAATSIDKVVETDPNAIHISTFAEPPAVDENDPEEDVYDEYEDGEEYDPGEEQQYADEEPAYDDIPAQEGESTLAEQYQLPPAVSSETIRPTQQVFVPNQQREYKNNNNQGQRRNNGHYNNKPGNKNK